MRKAFFDYELERWMPKEFTLPFCNNDYVMLTPKDILTKDDNWINSNDLKGDFAALAKSIPTMLQFEYVNLNETNNSVLVDTD